MGVQDHQDLQENHTMKTNEVILIEHLQDARHAVASYLNLYKFSEHVFKVFSENFPFEIQLAQLPDVIEECHVTINVNKVNILVEGVSIEFYRPDIIHFSIKNFKTKFEHHYEQALGDAMALQVSKEAALLEQRKHLVATTRQFEKIKNANDLHARGLIEAGEYTINID